ncbi:dTMP kinase [Roseibium polysiphoniae]|uniref:dTMP kinase n=1 Tax=Roseibium polysiphoniae TaxID=2571221 RepID=UPI00329695AC
MQGHFITFEGGDGAGKTTQINRLKGRLESCNLKVRVTREPGGSAGAEKIRTMLLSGNAKELGPRAEAMLFAAARADHVDSTIKPALDQGVWVLCDRFADSTRVYQSVDGVDLAYIDLLETASNAGLRPDLTFLIDVPAKIGLSRVGARSVPEGDAEPDRFENVDLSVYERRRAMYLKLAQSEPERFVIVDGTQEPKAVEKSIWRAVQENFPEVVKSTVA